MSILSSVLLYWSAISSVIAVASAARSISILPPTFPPTFRAAARSPEMVILPCWMLNDPPISAPAPTDTPTVPPTLITSRPLSLPATLAHALALTPTNADAWPDRVTPVRLTDAFPFALTCAPAKPITPCSNSISPTPSYPIDSLAVTLPSAPAFAAPCSETPTPSMALAKTAPLASAATPAKADALILASPKTGP